MLNIVRQLAVSVSMAIVAVLMVLGPVRAEEAPALRLLMIEQSGCAYCVAFNRDIAPIYKKTEQGAIAPLFHADLRKDMPEGITLASRPFVTPTFILIGQDGHEVSRLTGFPGEDFFWPFITEMIAEAQAISGAAALN
jgi:hypothetical protein